MGTLFSDLRQAVSRLCRTPLFTAVALITLSLSMGLCTTVFSLVNAALFKPLPLKQPNRLVMLRETSPGYPDGSVSSLDFQEWSKRTTTFAGLSGFRSNVFLLSDAGIPQRVTGSVVSPNWFEVTGTEPILGRGFRVEDVQNGGAVALSEQLWTRAFNRRPDIVNQVIKVGNRDVTVVAVMPPGFNYPNQAELWMPRIFESTPETRNLRTLGVLGRLRDGVSLRDSRRELAEISGKLQREYPESNRNWSGVVVPLRDFYIVGQSQVLLLVLMSSVAFLVLVAGASVANLSVARAIDRLRRAEAPGASPAKAWTRELVWDNIVLSLLVGVLGSGFAIIGTEALRQSIPFQLPFWMTISFDVRVFAFAVIVAVLIGLALSLVQKAHLRRTEGRERVEALRPRYLPRARTILAGISVGLAIVLVTSAGLLGKSLLDLSRVDPGFRADGIFTIQIPSLPQEAYASNQDVVGYYTKVGARLRALPNVVSVGAVSQIPLERSGGADSSLFVLGRPAASPRAVPKANSQVITPGYFATMGIPILKGRDFRASDADLQAPPTDCACEMRSEHGVAIIGTRTARELFPGAEAVGQRISVVSQKGPWLEIVGVAGDVRHRGLDRGVLLDVYAPMAQNPVRGMTFAVKTRLESAAAARMIDDEIRAVDRQHPPEKVSTMTDRITRSLWIPGFIASVFGTAAMVALVIMIAGLYNLLLPTASEAKAAPLPENPGALSLRPVVRAIAAGFVVGVPIVFLVARSMSQALNGVKSNDLGIILGLPVVLAAIALGLSALAVRRRQPRLKPIAPLPIELGR